MTRTDGLTHSNAPIGRLAALSILTLILFGLLPATAKAQEADETTPRVEVVFVLDTTGSMGGLIEGAKAKIWEIANLIISAEPTPDVRIGLVAYRDRGDAYVTQVFDLTDDIDSIYSSLQGFVADGGGDGPESVNQALAEAVSRISWTAHDDDEQALLRLIFLVGDAPPHMDYGNDVPYQTSVAEATRRGIVVNAVQCGSMGGTRPIWEQIAQLGGGSYTAIEQTGGVAVIETPFDEELARLNREIGSTVVAYGSLEQRLALEGYQTTAEEAAPAAAADRLSFNSRRGLIGGAGGDLVDALANGDVDLDDLSGDQLPEVMRSMSEDQRAAYIAEQSAHRQELQTRVDELLAQRRTYLDAERERRLAAGELSGFDAEVDRIIRTEAAAVGIEME